jgi:hypothetical protein
MVTATGPDVNGRAVTVKRVLAVTVSALLLCAALVAVLLRPDAAPLVGEQVNSLGPCTATGPLRTVSQINRFIESADGVDEFRGADVGIDVRLPGDSSLWLFGDTLHGTPAGDRLKRNSMLLFSPGCVRAVVPSGGGPVVPTRDDGVGYWPMSAWRVGTGESSVVYVMLQRVAAAPGVGFEFVTLGPAVAAFRLTPSGAPQLMMLRDLGPDDPSTEAPEWGSASALYAGWVYLYGTSTRDLPGVHGFALRVARVRPAYVADQSRWQYWDGTAWGPEAEDAAVLIGEAGGVSQTLSVWLQDGRWYVLSKQDEFLGRQIVVWSGPSPTGPFGPPQPVADLPCDLETGELRYMPLAHPQLLPRPGTVVVSYSRNRANLGEVCADPTLYRPHFLRVVLPGPQRTGDLSGPRTATKGRTRGQPRSGRTCGRPQPGPAERRRSRAP